MSTIFPKIMILVIALTVLSCGGNSGNSGHQAERNKPEEAKTRSAPRDSVKVINGHDKVYSPEGWLRMEGDMKDGKRHGIWTSFTPQGRVKSRNEYRDGVLEGLSAVFRDNGAMYYTGQYRNDKQVGRWEFYNEEGNLERTAHYDTSGAVINDPR